MSRRADSLEESGAIRTEMVNNGDNAIDIADPFARRLISQYLKRRQADLKLLRTALADGNYEHIRIAGHNMSGSGGAYGLEKVSDLGAALEEAAAAADDKRIDDLIDQLDGFLSTVRLT